jgi:hypothetical protein
MDFTKSHQHAPGGAPGSITKAPGNGARIDDRSHYPRSVRKPKTTLFGFRRAKGPPGLSRYLSNLCKESGNNTFRFPWSKKPRMDFLRSHKGFAWEWRPER